MAKAKKAVRIGFDLDGVLAQHSMMGFWFWLREMKEKILKSVHSPHYYYPSFFLERWAWMVIDWIKKPFSEKEAVFAFLAQNEKIKIAHFYLATGRFEFLEKLTKKWLKKYHLESFFRQVLINNKDIDPIIFKTNAIKNFNLDFFIDDDLDVINELRKRTRARFYWIVPPHKNRSENKNKAIISCQNVLEALKEINNGLS